jgi:2-polyprenyl-3-methyl-5-hydroxy-6-metoxy-1,4-benzoquinol methylase
MLHYRLHRDPKSSHQQIAQFVRHLNRGPVLDVGAAQGFLGQLVRDTGIAVDAVEPNPYWAEHAQLFYRQVFASTIEEAALPATTYRVVVCADVLEHTVDPVSVVRQLRRVATDDALFIISLPNVAHLAVRLMLLFGYFPRMERGILDRTHLHFFTRDTATAMLREAGLQVVHAQPTGVPLDELWPSGEGSRLFTILQRLQHMALLIAPRLFGFQWVFVAYQVPTQPPQPREQPVFSMTGSDQRADKSGVT